MINVATNARLVRDNLIRMQGAIGDTIDDSIDQALDHVIALLMPKTNVKTGRMKAGYRKRKVDALVWELEDEAYYAGYVIDGTSRNRGNPALQEVLNDSADDLEKALELAVSQVSIRYP